MVLLFATMYVTGPVNLASSSKASPLEIPSLSYIGHPAVPATKPSNPSTAFQVCPLAFTQCLPYFNWAGYVIVSPTGSGVTDVKATWIVPAITGFSGGYCPDVAKTYDSNAVWVGIDGFTNAYVEQTGTSSDCYYGSASYYAWYEFYPAPSVVLMTVHPGDVITAEVSYSAGAFTTTIKDVTTGTSGTSGPVTLTYTPPMASAEFIDESPSYMYNSFLGLTPVSPVTFAFATATIGGVTNSLAGWGSAYPADVYWLVSVDLDWPGTNGFGVQGILPSSAYVKADTGAYAGGTFRVTWSSAGP